MRNKYLIVIIIGILFFLPFISAINSFPNKNFIIESEGLNVLSGSAISYEVNGEMNNRIMMSINNSEKGKVVTVIVAYPKDKKFLGIEGGISIEEINPIDNKDILRAYDLVENKISNIELQEGKSLSSSVQITQDKQDLFEYKVFNISLESESVDLSFEKDEIKEMILPYSVNNIKAYTTTKSGDKDLLYMWILGSFAGGSGIAEDPYQISNCTQLQEARDNPTASYILINDINCSDSINWNNGTGFFPIGNATAGFTFSGIFNGKNHTISNLFINRNSNVEGLFGLVSGDISNIGIINANISSGSSSYTAILVAYLTTGGNITNSYAKGNVKGTGGLTGGLVGYSVGNILNSYSIANVTGNAASNTGGLVGGGTSAGIINKSYSAGNVIVGSGAFTGTASLKVYNSFYDNET